MGEAIIPYEYEETGLWRRAFANSPHSEKLLQIQQAYRKFWDRGCDVAKRIAIDLPGLTLHDREHFLALWARADQIAGEQYALTPMELFVFGGSILLHDAAHTLSVYPGGLEEIKTSIDWTDTHGQMQLLAVELAERENTFSSHGGENRSPSVEVPESDVLFAVLRKIHARRAEDLGFLELSVPGLGTFHLIEDDSLRAHLGKVVGAVAASHHWSASDIENRLVRKIGSLATYPSTWIVRPRLLACLLRCADACQVDQSRAPDFSYALLRAGRESELHWRAQNRVTQPYSEDGSLVFTTTFPFERTEAKAWWLIAEALEQAHNELTSCSRLLEDAGEPPFEIVRVAGAGSTNRLRDYIGADGWEPVHVGSKISDPKAVIALLGGQLLYGDDGLEIPLRELIQNASDAVRARAALAEAAGQEFSGQIGITADLHGDNEVAISVSDNGIGMTPYVIRDVLLDFGKSLWRSADVTSVFPGLASKKIQQSGRYGIGFFSLVSSAKSVTVTSRPFDRGIDAVKHLDFPDGLLGPCVMYGATSDDVYSDSSTSISFIVDMSKFDSLLQVFGEYLPAERAGEPTYECSLAERVGILAPTLDCDLLVKGLSSPLEVAHTKSWHSEDGEKWFTRLFSAREAAWTSVNSDHSRRMASIFSRVSQIIYKDGSPAGRAAVAYTHWPSGDYALNGLSTTSLPKGHSGIFMPDFMGIMPARSDGPRRLSRQPGMTATELSDWATGQAIRYSHMSKELHPSEVHRLCRTISEYGGDCTPISTILVNGSYVSVADVAALLVSGKTITISRYHEHRINDRAGIGEIGGVDSYNMDTDFDRVVDIDDDVYLVTTSSSSGYAMYYDLEVNSRVSFLKILSGVVGGAGYELVLSKTEMRKLGKYKEAPVLGIAVGDYLEIPCQELRVTSLLPPK